MFMVAPPPWHSTEMLRVFAGEVPVLELSTQDTDAVDAPALRKSAPPAGSEQLRSW